MNNENWQKVQKVRFNLIKLYKLINVLNHQEKQITWKLHPRFSFEVQLFCTKVVWLKQSKVWWAWTCSTHIHRITQFSLPNFKNLAMLLLYTWYSRVLLSHVVSIQSRNQFLKFENRVYYHVSAYCLWISSSQINIVTRH